MDNDWHEPENGHSKGMFYNTYCNARVTLADGPSPNLQKQLFQEGYTEPPRRFRIGSVIFAGEDRENLVRPDDPSFPLMTSYGGLLPFGDPDQGVPVGHSSFHPISLSRMAVKLHSR